MTRTVNRSAGVAALATVCSLWPCGSLYGATTRALGCILAKIGGGCLVEIGVLAITGGLIYLVSLIWALISRPKAREWFAAATQGDLERVKTLVAKGANIHATNPGGWTALHLAAERGHQHVVEFLLSKAGRPNKKTLVGYTPLHCAVMSGRTALVEYLISKGANVHARDREGQTPLDRAVAEGDQEMADLLRTHSAEQ